jgi:hypothetical protein
MLRKIELLSQEYSSDSSQRADDDKEGEDDLWTSSKKLRE